MIINLIHDRYTSVSPFVDMLQDMLRACRISMEVQVLDLRKASKEIFKQRVDDGRYDKWCNSLNALNEQTRNPLVYEKIINKSPDICQVIVMDKMCDLYKTTELTFFTKSNLEELKKEVVSLNPLETETTLRDIVDNGFFIPEGEKIIDMTNIKSLRDTVLLVFLRLGN